MWRITVRGVVQGVGFRPAVVRTAKKLGSRGIVRNDGSHVTIEVDTKPADFIEALGSELGPMARIEEVFTGPIDIEPPDEFSIMDSTPGARDSSLPFDTAICSNCLREMNDPDNRRYRYPFTNCTDCGARYTVIEKLPYDRERTTMEPFDPCEDCSFEYSDISFRRFHAQTLSCSSDGPTYRYLDSDLNEIASGWEAFLECARSIDRGRSIIVKGWGGMHIVSDPSMIRRLRDWYGRPYKPFAIMVRDIDTARSISEIEDNEIGLLSSPARPIVLVMKKQHPPSWAVEGVELASPGLGNIGLYLPYSGIHHLIFSALDGIGSDLRWFVMTSANPPGEPMSMTLDNARELGADGYFVHDRKIAARCDDSVIIPDPVGKGLIRSIGPFGIQASLIRKARGLVPDPIPAGHDRTLLAIGAERNVTVSVTSGGRIFTSPFVGNTRHPDVLEYARKSAERISYLFGADDIDTVICDLHPRYATRMLAREIAEEKGASLIEVQHHHAHAASLEADSGLDSIGTVVVDGVGYGSDGNPWGGEALISRCEGWHRIGHLEPFGIPGGDNSVYHPERISHWLSTSSGFDFTTGDNDKDRILRASHQNSVMTSSMGRLLDALSSLMLGITWRTYDGEPAIRLETLLARSKNPEIERFRLDRTGGIVPVIERWKILLEEIGTDGPYHPGIELDPARKADLSMGLVCSILDDLITTISDHNDVPLSDEKKPLIGISGGVAYSRPILERFIQTCRTTGASAVIHSRVPAGDGGISVGQARIGGKL